LRAAKAVDVIEMGYYVNRVARTPLAVEGPKGQPILTVARREEKGSDVNVAPHLLPVYCTRTSTQPSSSATTATLLSQ
jgi:hypothetical protein